MIEAKPIHLTTISKISRLCQKYRLHTLYLFGSRMKEISDWLASPNDPLQSSPSDIDIGAKMLNAKQMAVREKVRLTQDLEALFHDQRVDLVLLDEADPFLAVNIIRGKRLYAIDDYAADEYELYILRRAADLAPFEHIRQAKILTPTR